MSDVIHEGLPVAQPGRAIAQGIWVHPADFGVEVVAVSAVDDIGFILSPDDAILLAGRLVVAARKITNPPATEEPTP